MTKALNVPVRRVAMPNGWLEIEILETHWPFEELIGFGARDNPRRPFLFVSRVLGKHVPVRPSRMAEAHSALAASIPRYEGSAAVFGLAETATALGRGVAVALAQKNQTPVVYLQSTRHDLGETPWFTFEEPHSHAATHQVYRPCPAVGENLAEARTLILVDDEITTGTTLLHITRELCGRFPRIRDVVWASLVSWLPDTTLALHESALRKPISLVSLAAGRFTYEPSSIGLPRSPQLRDVRRLPLATADVYTDPARRGIVCLPQHDTCTAPPVGTGPWTVVGTGEFTYLPFQMALALENAGADVLFQSTSRSPILAGGDILRRAVVIDPYGTAPTMYAYNLPLPGERQVAVVYEHAALANRDTWRQALGAAAWIARSPCD